MNELTSQQALENILTWLKLSQEVHLAVDETQERSDRAITALTVSQKILKVTEYVNSQPTPPKDPDFKPIPFEGRWETREEENIRVNKEIEAAWGWPGNFIYY